MSRLHVLSLQSWSCYYEPSETYCRMWRWAANCCAPITNQANCLCTWISHNIRSLLITFCWPKTAPIAAPIKSFARKTTWAIVFAVLCILKLNAEKPLGSLNDMGHSTLADLLIYCTMSRGQLHYDPFASNWRKAWQDSFIGMSSYHHSLLREMISFPLETNRTSRLTWSTIYSRYHSFAPAWIVCATLRVSLAGRLHESSGCLYPEVLRNVDTTAWWKHIDLHERL